MKKITTTILCFLIGFFGAALFLDNSEILYIKAIIFFVGVVITTIIKIIIDNKKLPNPYENELNIKRIAAYTKIAEEYNIDKSSVGDIFCSGINWYYNEVDKINK